MRKIVLNGALLAFGYTIVDTTLTYLYPTDTERDQAQLVFASTGDTGSEPPPIPNTMEGPAYPRPTPEKPRATQRST